jgi:anaerobic magnesium-protoporphyrin IX monomethyl ester cyclase
MKILLIQPPENLEKLMGNGKHFAMPIPPTGIMYICAYLEKYGYNVDIIDAYFLKFNVPQTVKAIISHRPDIVGISCLTSNGPDVFYLVKALKKECPHLKIVLGNIHASVFSSFYIRKAGADFVIHGEGEETMLRLIQSLDQKKNDFSKISNLSWKDGGMVVDNLMRKSSEDISLDEIPWPARSKVSFRNYVEGVYEETNIRSSDMIFSSRGCVNRCTFCCIHSHQRYRYREPYDVINELEYIIRKYNIKHFTFGDPLFTVNKKRVLTICEEIIRRNITISWQCEGHARFINEEMLHAMKAAGCIEICYGIETATPRILVQINKNTDLNEITAAIELTIKAGIKAQGLFMFGFPEETEHDMMETIRFALSVPIARAQFAITTPYPGTKLYSNFVQSGQIRLKDEDDPGFVEDWRRYSAYISYTENEPIWCPEGIRPHRLKQIQKMALRKFYFRPRHFMAEIKKIRLSNIRHIKSFVTAAKNSFF